ncbi:MAG TPA: universal stress protein [Rhodospirillales bacterium]|nr:universal stress protein [Rhodospirillales bacterium]
MISTRKAPEKKALPTAVEYCQAFAATLHVVTVVPGFGMSFVGLYFPEDFKDKALAKADEDLGGFVGEHVPSGVKNRHSIGYGSVYEEILRICVESKCDLIVMASQRPELKDYLLGPNAARVVRHARCSVLVVRG